MTARTNRMMATVSIATVAVVVAAFSQGSADHRGTAAPILEASWRVLVTPIGPPIPPFVTFSTWGINGTFVESTQPGQGPGHGVLRRTSEREFVITFQKLLFGADGAVSGTLKVRELVRLDAGGDSFTGNATVDVFDPSGQRLASFCAKTQGTRIRVERPSCP